jgi:hypothetical protein
MLVGIDLNDISLFVDRDFQGFWSWHRQWHGAIVLRRDDEHRGSSRGSGSSVASSSRAPVHDAVAGKLKLTLQDQGELVLKNIERPVQAFRVELAS